jgi:hypothetical protein
MSRGTLYLVPAPIGNRGDISRRALRHYPHAFRQLRDAVDRRMTEYSAVVTHPKQQP